MPYDSTIYSLALAAGGAVSAVIGCLILCKFKNGQMSKWESIPRAKISGAILGFAALMAFIPNAVPVLGGNPFPYLFAASVIFVVLSYFYLDYLFARSFAGALIIAAHFLLKESYAYDLKLSWIFALMCFALGTLGIFIAAKPHYMRDIIRKCFADWRWRHASAAFFIIFALAAVGQLIQLFPKQAV